MRHLLNKQGLLDQMNTGYKRTVEYHKGGGVAGRIEKAASFSPALNALKGSSEPKPISKGPGFQPQPGATTSPTAGGGKGGGNPGPGMGVGGNPGPGMGVDDNQAGMPVNTDGFNRGLGTIGEAPVTFQPQPYTPPTQPVAPLPGTPPTQPVAPLPNSGGGKGGSSNGLRPGMGLFGLGARSFSKDGQGFGSARSSGGK